MKKLIALIAMTIMVVGAAGCQAQLTDLQLLEQAFANMETAESARTEASITIKMMGMTIDPITYEILFEKPDKTYMKMDADLFGTGEAATIEILLEDDAIKVRSGLFDELDAELQEILRESVAQEVENPSQYESILLELGDTTEFEAIDNPAGLDAKDYKAFKVTLEGQKLKDMVLDQMSFEDDFLPPDIEELNPEERDLVLAAIDEMLNDFTVKMEVVLVVNTKTKYFHHLKLNLDMSFPFPDFTGFGQQEVLNMSYIIEINYLEINTDLEFPTFQ